MQTLMILIGRHDCLLLQNIFALTKKVIRLSCKIFRDSRTKCVCVVCGMDLAQKTIISDIKLVGTTIVLTTY